MTNKSRIGDKVKDPIRLSAEITPGPVSSQKQMRAWRSFWQKFTAEVKSG